MARIITVGNTKGGVGKSTLAVQIALALRLLDYRVWLVDGDRQGTSLGAMTIRAEGGRETIAASAYPDGATLRAQVTQQRSNYDFIVIDAGGRDSTALRAGLMISDLILIPFKPRSFDVWALSDIASLLSEARAGHDIDALAVLNIADTSGSDNSDAVDAIKEIDGIELVMTKDAEDRPTPLLIGDRKSIAHASANGLHISEYKVPKKGKDAKAIAEVDALVSMLIQYQTDIA